MKNWLKKCSVALLVFSMIGTTMPVYAADAPAAEEQTTESQQTEGQASEPQADESQDVYKRQVLDKESDICYTESNAYTNKTYEVTKC